MNLWMRRRVSRPLLSPSSFPFSLPSSVDVEEKLTHGSGFGYAWALARRLALNRKIDAIVKAPKNKRKKSKRDGEDVSFLSFLSFSFSLSFRFSHLDIILYPHSEIILISLFTIR